MFNATSLKGRTIVITGAGQGIGLAISRKSIRLGAPVAVVDLDGPSLAAEQTERGAFYP